MTWSYDVFGNAVATASFLSMTDSLVVESIATVDLTAAQWPVFDIAASAIHYPFSYENRDWVDLGGLALPQYHDPEARLGEFSGYLFNENELLAGSTERGSTHAWAEVYIPGAGWVPFDPTNRSMGGANLIPVAVTREIEGAVPVSGSFVGGSNAFLGIDVTVEVKEVLA